jgi:hypothetical protein
MAKKKGSASKAAPARPAKASAPAGRTEPVYTVITFVTFVAMLVGCALLYVDFDEYGQNSPPKEAVPALPKLGDEVKAAATPKVVTPAPDPTMP